MSLIGFKVCFTKIFLTQVNARKRFKVSLPDANKAKFPDKSFTDSTECTVQP